MSAFDKLKKVADKPKAKKSSAKDITDPSMHQVCDSFVKASKEFKNAEAALKQTHEEVLSYMRPLHAASIKDGSLFKTYKLNEALMCIFTDRFSALKEHDLEDAKQKLVTAKVPVERLFKEKLKLKLKENIAENEKEISTLIEKLGEDLLSKYFEVSVETVPVEDFDKALSREGVYGELSDIVERIRYKPTIRVA